MGFFQELADAFGMGDNNDRHHDVRGWTVSDDRGDTLGKMDDWLYDQDSREIRYGVVNADNRRVLVPVGDLGFDDDRRAVIARGYDKSRLAGLKAYETSGWNDDVERAHYRDVYPDWKDSDQLNYASDRFRGDVPQRIQLMEEQLRVGKRDVQAGEVTVGKKPVTEEVSEDVTLRRERIEINRTPVNEPVEGAAPIIGEAETIRVPLYAEEAVVEKKPFIREEIEINKVAETRTETIRDQVTHEELVTDGLDDTRREAEFAAAEPTEAELAERRRLSEDVDVVPDDGTDTIL